MERKNISDQMFPLRLILVCVNREEIPFVFYLSENGEFRFSHVPEELQKGLPWFFDMKTPHRRKQIVPRAKKQKKT